MSSPALSSQRRTALWDAMLDADFNVCYWTLMSQRYTRYDEWFRNLILLSSSGTVAAWGIWSNYPLAWKVFSGASALAALLHPRICQNERLQRMSRLVGTWKQIAVNFQLLWTEDEHLQDSNAWKQFEKLQKDVVKVDETRLPASKKLEFKAAEQMLKKRGLPKELIRELLNGHR
jgi:hypothetical protein